MTFDIDRNQFAVFELFHEHDVGAGTLPFWMQDPLTHGWPIFTTTGEQLLTDDGAPLLLAEYALYLFSDQLPQISIIGIRFRVAMSLWRMP